MRKHIIAILGLGLVLGGTARAQTIIPPDPIPVEELRGFDRYVIGGDLGSPGGPLTEEQLTRRMSRLYWYQSRILRAQVDGEYRVAEEFLHRAMSEVDALAAQEDITGLARYKELFRTIVTEHDQYFGEDYAASQREYGDVFALRAEMFDFQATITNPTAEATQLPEIEPVATTVPMTQNRAVEGSIQWLLSDKRETILRFTRRADTYFPMIEQIFREEGVPDELKYLAVGESGLRPRVVSSASAVGMWQFMRATGAAYGLEVNDYVDERMDPIKATRAAAKHLKDLHRTYWGDWHVALAGYNCSPRCIKRAISRAGRTTANPPSFWTMSPYLPKQTQGYIPQFIAFALIMSNPTAFGLPAASDGPEFAYDVVPVLGMLSLETIAEMVGTTKDEIQDLNPELRRGVLPPSAEPYPLRIPLNTFARFAEAFEQLPDSKKRPPATHVVRRGDTLGRISSRYGTSVQTLMRTNGLRRTVIHPGQELVVPGASRRGVAELSGDGVESVRWGERVRRPIEFNEEIAETAKRSTPARLASTSSSTRNVSTAARSTSAATITHRVRRGDTLGRLASRYNTSVRAIQQQNGLRGTRIRVGQQLKIPQEAQIHTVRRGENLTRIASRYGTTVQKIKSANNLRSSRIYPGQKLKIL
ncbi:MAG: LysM peptidoglycan-binding domain-containing protein [Bacteroidota bacterium]|nr:LysM peptidoglycan-binding domain-containing protein [Bacteroidota bacterium]MDE2835681.1 LysM peptidoglycan-binding domain-containing protein [Bacteroidota bacterium]MDE2956625.1 LysM peptidoglycan-binding domain-containing protein [Bacteroidota bacterium]